MRKFALLLLALPAAAQDDGTALFYKGFWLEQAEGKLDEAAALYAQLLKEKPDAAEAPRALLGLVRIKVARNEDAKELVAELERRYPAAKEEIAGARRIVGGRPNSFADLVREGDSGVERKIKTLYASRLGTMTEPDRTFLVDLGTAAHPMLGAVLRDTFPDSVSLATRVLLLQRTPEAYAVLAHALLDDSAVFRGLIVAGLDYCQAAPLVLVEALEKLYGSAPPRLRVEVVRRLATLAGYEGDGKERAYAVLARALEDDEAGVRSVAVAVEGAPDAYVDALLRRLEAKDPGMWNACNLLARLADRAAFRQRIETVFDGHPIDWKHLPDPVHEEGALLLARRIERELKAGNRDNGVYNLAYTCSGRSPKAAAGLLLVAMELDDWQLATKVLKGMGDRERVQYLGEHAAALRTAALAYAPAPGEPDRRVVMDVIGALGLGPADLPAIADALRRRGERGMPALLLDADRLEPLGPGQAGALVSYCRDGKQVAMLLNAGRRFAQREDSGVEFFRQVVPRAGPECADALRKVAEKPAIAPIVAERLLDAVGPEWGWTTEEPRAGETRGDNQPGPSAWNGLYERSVLTTPAVRALVAPRTDDPRLEVVVAAVAAASADKTEAGTDALKKALQSKWQDARGMALLLLATRADDAPAIVREFATRKDLAVADRGSVTNAIWVAKGPAMTAIAADLVREDPAWGVLWDVYYLLAPKEAVELALNAIPPTVESLGVLVQADDPRRIAIFRAVLNGTDRDAIRVVLRAVYEQYLVELGEEALSQLRSPDEETRKVAKAAIEKLKFYAEAKKAFEK